MRHAPQHSSGASDRDHTTPRLRAFVAPLLLLVVASVQIVRVFTAGQSRWRGGGFGMYAELHPNATQVWLVETGPVATRPALLSESDGAPTAPLVARCMRLRSQTCLGEIARVLPQSAGPRRLEIWLPRFDAHSGTLSRQRVAALDF